jgi:HK97 family phage major capsid protein
LITGDKEKLQVLVEGTDGLGGYLVPVEFQNMIVEDLRDATVMRQIANTITTNSNELHLPRLDTRPQAQWRNEAAVKATSTAQFSELVFTPYSLASIVPLSQELSDDATLGVNGSIVNYIAGLMTQSLAEKEDKAFWTGDGSGKPTGVSTYSVGSRVKGSNFADTIISLFHDMKQGYRGRAVWVGSSYVLAQLRQLKDSQNRYLVQNLGDTPYGSLLGRPMYEQNDLAQSELYLGDFSYYQIVDRSGISVRVSDEATVGGSSAFEKNLVFVATSH